MIAPTTLDKINALPEAVQEQLFLYVDFLFAVYRADTDEISEENFLNDFELSKAGKDFLEKRAQASVDHPEKLKSWKKVREEMAQKHNWPKN